jgi:hypothetical protein
MQTVGAGRHRPASASACRPEEDLAPDRPDFITLSRHRDLQGRRHALWVRRGILAVLALLPLLAVANVFGQRATTATSSGPAASLEVHMPSAVRPGLLYEARFTITANEKLAAATLTFGSDWLEGLTVNTIEPSPVGETSENGSLVLVLGPIDAGKEFRLVFQLQVNPTSYGRRDQDVVLSDGDRAVASVHRTLTIYP